MGRWRGGRARGGRKRRVQEREWEKDESSILTRVFTLLSFSFFLKKKTVLEMTQMTLESLKQLKVAELREELDRRGLDSTGLKAALLARLPAAQAAVAILCASAQAGAWQRRGTREQQRRRPPKC